MKKTRAGMPIREQLIRMTPVCFIAALLAVIVVAESGIVSEQQRVA